ncbi:hypothetical protein [Lysobacter enzymogenes]|uniref:hypothetical protein n=1 Tax=Lysobacter enzymogenes TaxID=69 RepID=UPI000895F673|nr:hypothetical protein [Lysobacter enzymogenes]SDX70662.1 hypothetical protein SAMN05421681_10773 [Lysobacter enzymogenes]
MSDLQKRIYEAMGTVADLLIERLQEPFDDRSPRDGREDTLEASRKALELIEVLTEHATEPATVEGVTLLSKKVELRLALMEKMQKL